MENLSIFVENISDYLVGNDLTASQFCKRAHIAERAMAKWVSKQYYPEIRSAIKVATLLDFSLDYLFGLTNTHAPYREIDTSCFLVRFQGLCETRGITPYRIAKDCKLNQTMLSRWRQGKFPRTETMIKLANYFSVSLDYLVGQA